MSKRITISTATPNDQGGVIPNSVLDFKRFNKNPVMLLQHSWNSLPIGRWTDLKQNEKGNWTAIPDFHGLTTESITTKALYDAGYIKASSIGGDCTWKQNVSGQYAQDAKGNREAEKFDLYEISIVTLPSNHEAVVEEDDDILAAKIYDRSELATIGNSITTLSSKFNPHTMDPKEKEAADKLDQTKLASDKAAADKALEDARAVLAAAEANAEATNKKIELLSSDKAPGLPAWLKEIMHLGGRVIFGGEKTVEAPAPKDEPTTLPPKKAVSEQQPTPIGLKAEAAEKAKEGLDKAKEKAAASIQKAKEAKEKADADDGDDEMKAAANAAHLEAAASMKECEEAEESYNKAKKEAEEDEEDGDANLRAKPGKKTTQASTMNQKPQLKSTAELQAELKLAAPPEHTSRVKAMSGTSFTALASDKKEGKKLLDRVMYADAGNKDIADYAVVANALLADPRYKPLVDKARFMVNVDASRMPSLMGNPNARNGVDLKHFAAQLNSGRIDNMDRLGQMRQLTTLSSSDNALASPALNAIEFLSLAIFALFPNDSWKDDVSMFSAEVTGKNTGVIWANIAAAPTFTKGTAPANTSPYTYSDTAVSVALTPYYVPATQWMPITMHQLRYDQQSTGWAQIFAGWNAFIDDELLYQLLSLTPVASIFGSTGISGYQSTAATFAVAAGAADPNSFYWNSAFAGTLLKPVFNDIISIEKIYQRQNFNLEVQKPMLILDPSQMAYIMQDPDTKTFLTRFLETSQGSVLKISNTTIKTRSRVGMYDPASGLIKDPGGVIPATAVGASFGCIPSQAALAIGMLDVFMVQNPNTYGYVMSADTRMGAALLRANGAGAVAYTYGSGQLVP